MRTELGVAPNTPLILFVGRLVEQKDVSTLLRAMGRLGEPRSVLLIAGTGPLRQALEAQAASLGVGDSVRFLGQRDDTSALMSAADMVVLPSLVEGLSNVVLESMMCGRTVIASRTGGNVELVEHERTGLLFDVGDDASLALCMRRLVDSPGLRTALGQAAHDKALRAFSVPAMVAAFTAQYEEAAQRRVPLS
jgi:glycosyltransferase involved in cell wall biosynthesis